MKSRIDAQTESVRFGFEGVLMPDRVRQLFELSNGSQSEVVKSQKHKGMELFQLREGDIVSSGVQIIALTTRIQQLQTHMTTHRKDNSTKRGLQTLIARCQQLLDYLERTNFVSYRNVVKILGLFR
jgi:small subunit ribosomal protein S15